MLKKDELKVLKLLFSDLTADLTIMDIARLLNQNYVQAYRTVYNLAKSGHIILKSIGRSRIVKLDLAKTRPSYILAEIERAEDICRKNISVSVVRKEIQEADKNFICILPKTFFQGIKPRH